MTTLRALALCCSSRPSPAPSNSELLGRRVLTALVEHDVDGDLIRVDRHMRPGVSTDEGHHDVWPTIRAKILDSDLLIITTSIWSGQPSSVCKMVLKRLDAELPDTDQQGQRLTYGKVAAVAVLGSEDRAHHLTAEVFHALNDIGFTIPAAGSTYWVDEAMNTLRYGPAGPNPQTADQTTQALAASAAHLARLLNERPYPSARTRPSRPHDTPQQVRRFLEPESRQRGATDPT